MNVKVSVEGGKLKIVIGDKVGLEMAFADARKLYHLLGRTLGKITLPTPGLRTCADCRGVVNRPTAHHTSVTPYTDASKFYLPLPTVVGLPYQELSWGLADSSRRVTFCLESRAKFLWSSMALEHLLGDIASTRSSKSLLDSDSTSALQTPQSQPGEQDSFIREYMQWVEAKADAYEQEAIVISQEEFDDLYDDACLEAMRMEDKLP